MATEERSIEISYKANLKDLISKLKTLPNVTGEEAKKMVSALDKQLKQAEKAAKKSATAQKKAAIATGKAFKDNTKYIKKMADSATAANNKLGNVAESAGDIDRGFVSMAMALELLNPELRLAADTSAEVAAITEGVLLTIKNLNPVILVSAAAVAVLSLGWAQYSKVQKLAIENAIQIRLEQNQQNEIIDQTSKNLKKATENYELINAELLVFTGVMSSASLEAIKLKNATRGMFSTAEIDERIKQHEKDIDLIFLAGDGTKKLSEAEKERLKTLQVQTAGVKQNLDLSKANSKLAENLRIIQGSITDKIKVEEKSRAAIFQIANKSTKKAQELADAKTRQADRESAAAKAAERSKKAITATAAAEATRLKIADERLAEAEAAAKQENETLKAQEKLNNILRDQGATDHELKLIQIDEKHSREKESLQEIGAMTGDYRGVLEAMHDNEMGRIDEIRGAWRSLIKDKMNNAREFGTQFTKSMSAFATATQEYLENTDKATEASTAKLFKLNQAAAVADIAMTTAQTIVKSVGLRPVAGAILATAALAAGAAQTAAVMSQKPPTMHMGGIAPDERSTIILPGESVLDRTTTRNLGDEGIRSLQNGSQSSAEVVILQPFKHIDRYNRSSRRRSGIRSGSGVF
tara:strand:+ start:1547 stop:3466 length:1920 start_codon:yes stop_codon:yes gene_type:complete